MAVQFGIFEVNEEGIKVEMPNNLSYKINKNSVFEVQSYKERFVWHWPLMMMTKPWVSEPDLMHFNTAFFFALDYFSEEDSVKNVVSTYRTLLIQKWLLNNKNCVGADCLDDLQQVFEQRPEYQKKI
ncbi:hypothetical protein ASG01_00305 [Chryseobacterium sp. Leaf180]|jgi:hypothetical protein|uniref:hypothetical protein n=1 Tax=Chryseobacterium sp. Leaf180 TaxID=1736289 RepID=UPI0007010C60|nr:hypothetical protein [Chryseobacterium sp. Leaf180]KQR94365.1 hypothetical protein ASG01_00305 [Chryseobacterium sp. Leaf180]